MRTNLVVVMDDIGSISVAKDTTLAMMLEGQRREYRLWYLNEHHLYLHGGQAWATLWPVEVRDDPADWYSLGEPEDRALGDRDLVLMRSDPPVDIAYLHATYLLERAEAAGALVVNRPRSLRDFNEKLAISHFPRLIPETLVTSNREKLRAFVERRGKAVLKPLDGMGGHSIFLVEAGDPNLNVIAETLTDGARLALAQEYLPQIVDGDKRVLLVHGRPVEYMLARIPGKQDFRGNLARGGQGVGRPLGPDERAIAEAVGPVMIEHGIEFAGLDIIGNRLTEINVTSPTCVRELDRQFGINIISELYDAVDP